MLPNAIRTTLGGVAAALALLAVAEPAHANSVSIDFLTTSGQSDLVAGLPRILKVSGTSSVRQRLYIKHRQLGGPPCEANVRADRGSWFREYGSDTRHSEPGPQVDGAFDRREVFTWSTPGTFVFCIYLAQSRDTITTAITQTLTFRSPNGSITATVSPATPRPGQEANVTVTGASEAPRRVFAKVRPAGADCAPNFSSDTGDTVINGHQVDGAFSIPAKLTRATPGNYVLCLWLADAGDSATLIAGPQPQPFRVVQPPPRVSSAHVVTCSTQRRVRNFRARSVGSVCVRYRFATQPLAGNTLTVTFVRPGGRTHSRVRGTWQEGQTQPILLGPLTNRAYNRRPGTWSAILRVGGKQVTTTTFRVRR